MHLDNKLFPDVRNENNITDIRYNVGIMGGTFNPIHNAHLMMASQTLSQLCLDKVLFMPSRKPPHKSNSHILDDNLRSDMVKLAISGTEGFEFSDLELKREGYTYTSDTLRELTKANPDTHYYFIMGMDSFLYLDKWYEPEVIMKLASIVVFGRIPADSNEFERQKEKLSKLYGADIIFLSAPYMNISSTEIRHSILNGIATSGMLPEKVYKYILKLKFYM